jgi:hypothetical protein
MDYVNGSPYITPESKIAGFLHAAAYIITGAAVSVLGFLALAVSYNA